MGRFQTQSFSCPQDASSSWHLCVIEYCQPRSSPELWCPEFLLAFHCVGLIDCLAPQFPDLADLAWSESPLINLNCQVWLRSPLWITKTFLSLGKFEGFISYLSGVRDKGKTFIWARPDSLPYILSYSTYILQWRVFLFAPIGYKLLKGKLTGCVMESPKARILESGCLGCDLSSVLSWYCDLTLCLISKVVCMMMPVRGLFWRLKVKILEE